MLYRNMQMSIYIYNFIHFKNFITKHWNFDVLQEEDELVFIAF